MALRNYLVTQSQQTCKTALAAKDWKRLEAAAATWSGWEPDKAEPWIYYAEAVQQQGDLARSAELLGRVPDGDPKTPQALLERNALLFGPVNRPLEGLATCERILRLQPHAGEALQRIIFYYALSLQRDRLLESIRTAMERGCDTPDNYVYLIGVDFLHFSNGFEVNTRWLIAEPENEDYQVARAINFYRAKAYEWTDESNTDVAAVAEAERYFAELVDKYPQNRELLAFFLDRAAQKGDAAEVARLLQQAPADTATDSRFWRFQGWLLADQEKDEQAVEAFEKAIELNPYDWRSRHQLAAVLRNLERLEEVAEQQELAAEGKILRQVLLELPNARAVPVPLLRKMVDYCTRCGDHETARYLNRRVQGIAGG